MECVLAWTMGRIWTQMRQVGLRECQVEQMG